MEQGGGALTVTICEQEEVHPLPSVMVTERVYEPANPASTVTVPAFAAPLMAPLPPILHEYEAIPAVAE